MKSNESSPMWKRRLLRLTLLSGCARSGGLDGLGWIATYGSGQKMNVQIRFMSRGGSDTPTPDLSIEVDDLNAALEHMQAAGFPRRALGRSALLCARSLREAPQFPHPPRVMARTNVVASHATCRQAQLNSCALPIN